jgi:hypothetical protein
VLDVRFSGLDSPGAFAIAPAAGANAGASSGQPNARAATLASARVGSVNQAIEGIGSGGTDVPGNRPLPWAL